MDLKGSYEQKVIDILDRNRSKSPEEQKQYKYFQNRLFVKTLTGYSERSDGQITKINWFKVTNPETLKQLEKLPVFC